MRFYDYIDNLDTKYKKIMLCIGKDKKLITLKDIEIINTYGLREVEKVGASKILPFTDLVVIKEK